MLNLQNIVCTFLIRICDSINDYLRNGGKHPRQEVGDGYIFVKSL